ncbi:MAG: HAMP domain-containing sensor histidine kinase [Candidatus Ozemobacteraceae bacterium]
MIAGTEKSSIEATSGSQTAAISGLSGGMRTELIQLWFFAVLMGLTYSLTLVAGMPYAGSERVLITFTMFVVMNLLGVLIGGIGFRMIPTRGLVLDVARPLFVALILTGVGNTFDLVMWIGGIIPLKTAMVSNICFLIALTLGGFGIFRLCRLCLVTPGGLSVSLFSLFICGYLGIAWLIDPLVFSGIRGIAENPKEALFGFLYAVIATFCAAIAWEIWCNARGQLRHAARLISLGAFLLSSGCFLYGLLFARHSTMEVSASSLHILIALAYLSIGLGILRMGTTMTHLFNPDFKMLDPREPLVTIFGESIGVKVFEELSRQIVASNAALHQAELENQAKSKFLAMMSHELRTPLTSIIAYSQMMSDEKSPIGERMPSDSREFSRRVYASAKHLLGLIDGILSYSRVEAGRRLGEAELISLEELFEFMIHQAQAMISDEGPIFHHSAPKIPFQLFVDPQTIRQILMNLLTNAFKFARSGSVSLIAEVSGRDVTFRIEDSGIGIPADELSRIFEPFYQVSSGTARHFGGTGLGLAIVKRLLDEIGGEIKIHSVVDHGTSVIVRLPGVVHEHRPTVPVHSRNTVDS